MNNSMLYGHRILCANMHIRSMHLLCFFFFNSFYSFPYFHLHTMDDAESKENWIHTHKHTLAIIKQIKHERNVIDILFGFCLIKWCCASMESTIHLYERHTLWVLSSKKKIDDANDDGDDCNNSNDLGDSLLSRCSFPFTSCCSFVWIFVGLFFFIRFSNWLCVRPQTCQLHFANEKNWRWMQQQSKRNEIKHNRNWNIGTNSRLGSTCLSLRSFFFFRFWRR